MTLEEKINETMEAIEPEPPEKKWKIGETTVDIEIPNATGFGGQTIIGGVNVSGVLQQIEFSAGVGDVNRLKLRLVAMPIKLKTIAEVIITETMPEADEG